MCILQLNGMLQTIPILYVKSAPTEEEWKECWYKPFVGDVLAGGFFSKQFTEESAKKRAKELEGIDKRTISQIEKELLDARHFAFNGWKTINRSDVIPLTTFQYQNYCDKTRHRDNINLGKNENSWLTENSLYANE